MLISCADPNKDPPSRAAAADVVEEYLKAVEVSDAAAVAALAPKENVADSDAAKKIAQYGGRDAETAQVTYREDFGGQVLKVRIVDPSEAGSAATEDLLLVGDSGEWNVALGEALGGSPPSSTEPPD